MSVEWNKFSWKMGMKVVHVRDLLKVNGWALQTGRGATIGIIVIVGSLGMPLIAVTIELPGFVLVVATVESVGLTPMVEMIGTVGLLLMVGTALIVEMIGNVGLILTVGTIESVGSGYSWISLEENRDFEEIEEE